jgi:hypothetical protein
VVRIGTIHHTNLPRSCRSHWDRIQSQQGGNPAGKYGVVRLPPSAYPPGFQALAKNFSTPTGFPAQIFFNISFILGPRDAGG